jgi:predicted DsbA family dithiol-disulfide isomerase
MKVEIWSDIACPWCYIGKRRFEKALAQFEHRIDVEVIWRSFELDPGAPPSYEGSQAELLAKKYGVPVEQARAMNQRMTEEARKEGLEFRFDISKPGNTFDAHRVIHYADTVDRRDAVVERFFRGYLGEGAAIGDADTLVRLGADAGLEAGAVRTVLRTDAYSLEVREDEARARRFGISGVPFFALNERLGVSGAQTPDVLLAALRQAYEDKSGLVVVAGDGVDKCDDEGCTI